MNILQRVKDWLPLVVWLAAPFVLGLATFLFMSSLLAESQNQQPSAPSGHQPQEPSTKNQELGLAVPCQIVEVYDGDTLTVRVQADVRVRLVDCWAPEIRTKDDAEKVRGLAARDHLRTLAPVNSSAVLSISLDGVDRLDDLLTLGRVLGKVSVENQDLSAQQFAAVCLMLIMGGVTILILVGIATLIRGLLSLKV